MTDQSFAPPVSPTPASTPTPTVTDARAGFWIRFGASFVDGIIVGIPALVLEAALKGVGSGLALLLGIVYYSAFEGGETGQTFGKRACGIRVVDASTGGPIGYARGFLRYIGRIVSSIPIFLGYFWMLWDPNKQTWHDKIANSVVVPDDRG
ncbi:MAG TPA: RDD family protein [Baekduia sp.]